MPPTGANTMVKDPEYCNWLKVGLALYYLKVGLSSFIQDEMDAMHQFIIQKLYNGSVVPALLCTSCNAKDVKQSRNVYTWKFRYPCPISLCDTWLTELLALHTNPTSNKLYCENCDVTAWPRVSWECAKLYMPRGQTVTNTGPAQSDSQALLTLMANCKYLHSKLSQGGIQLTHTVSKIRNRVMHSGDMRLSDNDRKHFIQDIINLLEDPNHLKSLEECKQAVTEINKINMDSLDVVFNIDLEMKALRECVNDCRQELGLHKVEIEKTVDSLKEELNECVNDCRQELGLHKVETEKTVNSLKEELKECVNDCRQELGLHKVETEKTVNSLKEELKECVNDCRQELGVHKVETEKTVDSLKVELKDLNFKFEKEMELIKESTSQTSRATADVRDLQLLFIKAYESVQIISMNPVFDNSVNWKDLEDFYTDIVIEEEKEESAQRIKNEQQFNKKVTSFRQIFEKGDRKVTRIILKAPAGQGKSTFCRKLVHTWCSVQKKRLNIHTFDGISDRSETNGMKDEDEMLRFDVLLYICLRDISEEKTLMDVAHAQFPLHETQDLYYRSHIEALIGQAEDNKVLLVMDGLDEKEDSSTFIKKIMQKRLYPNLTVLATTRPWKIGQLSLIRSAHIDLLLDLQGFSYENSMLFAKRIFDKYYNEESAIEQFQQDISTNYVIGSLIHVPLLLLFIVHVWYERKSFAQTIYKLYLEMLNVIVNRCMEGKERIGKDEGRQDKKKHLLPKTWPLESTTFIVNPKLRKLSLVKHFGEEFLAALCEVANHFLVTACGETSLVFDEEALLELLGKDGTSKLQTALDLGILSKSESPGIFRKRIRLTFLHKTVQEFLAAINICCREDRCNIFLDSLNTLDDVFQNEQIIKFAAGISTTQCQKIFEKIYEVCDKERAVLLRPFRMHDLSRFSIDCIREAGGEPLNLKLHCIILTNQEDWNVLQSVLRNTLNVGNHLKYLYLNSCILDNDTLVLIEFKCLTRLQLVHMTIRGKLLLSKCTHLKSLKLNYCTLDDDVLDLSESTCLEYLTLVDVTMKGKLLLSKCTHLQYLKLKYCTLHDDVLDLSESNCLEYLSLKNVTMKGKLLLSKCTRLYYLKLASCILEVAVFDLSECTCLGWFLCDNMTMTGRGRLLCTQPKKLMLVKRNLSEFSLDLSVPTCSIKQIPQLQNASMENADLNDALLSLDNVNNCHELTLNTVTMSKECKEVFCNSLSQCKQPYGLLIKNVDLCDALLRLDRMNYLSELNLDTVTMSKECKEMFCNSLSQCKQLYRLSIKNVDLCDALLRLDSVNHFHGLNLDTVTMSKECKEVFCNSLSQCKQLYRLSIKNVDLCDALLRLDSMNYLNELNLDTVNMSKECKEVFCNSLSQCKQLQRLSIKNVEWCDGLLSLDSVNYLNELNLDTVNMSKECKEVFCNSLSQCKQLERLSIKNVDLCDALLSLDGVSYFHELNLDKVSMSKECKEVFCNSLSQCKQLYRLSIKNVDLCDALLSFDSVKYVNLDNVTMSKECKEVFCNSLSQCKKLQRLSIKNVDLCGALLRLDSVNNLYELTLDSVKMSKECMEVFCNSLSQCKQLERLSIKNVEWCDGLRELYNMKELNDVTLEKVKMGTLSKVLMCKSLSQCTQLQNLSLKTLDLGDGLLNLNSLEILHSLSIDNVTMCKDGYMILCNSMSMCEQLCTLSLKNLDLGDGLLSLNNLGMLSSVSIDNVTMCKDGYVILCNSMSMCEQLCTLSLKNLDLGDGLLSLNNLGMLSSVSIDNVTMCKDGYVILCNSMSMCEQLCTLSLKNLDLGDGLLSLNNLDNLKELELVKITMSLECAYYIKSSLQHLKSCFSLFTNFQLDTRELSIEVIADICDKCVVNYTNKRDDDDDLEDDDGDDLDYDYDDDDYDNGDDLDYDYDDDDDVLDDYGGLFDGDVYDYLC